MIKPSHYLLLLLGGFLITCTNNDKTPITKITPTESLSFELTSGDEADWSDVNDWDGASGGIRSNGFYSPPDGKSYAYQQGEGSWISRETGHVIQAGLTYTLKLWSRSVNRPGNTATTRLQAGFLKGGDKIAFVLRKTLLNKIND